MKEENNMHPVFLIQNIYNFGHFLIYTSVFTKWALSRGYVVHIMGRSLGKFRKKFEDSQFVVIHDDAPDESLHPSLVTQGRNELLTESFNRLLEMQKKLHPEATLLISTDDYIFERIFLTDDTFSFQYPTYGILTFGNRERYTAFADSYARDVARFIQSRSPFAAIFTLDEYHAADADADPDYLIFLPDIFAADSSFSYGIESDTAQNLVRFLNSGSGPVIPILGKFDQRKNNCLVLELAISIPNASCVVLGERVPSLDDPQVNTLLDMLRSRGSLFESQTYVDEGLLHLVVSHERTVFLPLPYCCHYGSSGIQLLGLHYGKPSVVPSNGLMARRVLTHGLGEVFTPGDAAGFMEACHRVIALGADHFVTNCANYMKLYNETYRGLVIDQAVGRSSEDSVKKGILSEAVSDSSFATVIPGAVNLFFASKGVAALHCLDQALALEPACPVLLYRKVVILWSLSRLAEAEHTLRELFDTRITEEFDFFVRLVIRDAEIANTESGQTSAQDVMDILVLAQKAAGERDIRFILTPVTWRQAGVILARTGCHHQAIKCFQAALHLVPEWHDCRLNLCDVFRYAAQYDESLYELIVLEEMAPGWPGIHHKRGQVYFEKGLSAQALEQFQKEFEESPHYRAAARYIAMLLQDK